MQALASRCNGIAAAPKVAAPRCIALRATATPLVVVAVGQKGGKLKTRKVRAKPAPNSNPQVRVPRALLVGGFHVLPISVS